jgi:hypothetical protein
MGHVKCKEVKMDTTQLNKVTTNKMELLDQWINELTFPAKSEAFIHVVRDYKSQDSHFKEFYIYTETHKYRITAIDRDDDGYLGCGATVRKRRPGEDWDRGNDLPDGDFTVETWNKIIKGIVNYELIKLSEHIKPIIYE